MNRYITFDMLLELAKNCHEDIIMQEYEEGLDYSMCVLADHGRVLHALGFKTAAMALSDRSVSIDDEQLAREPKLAIVLGTEGDGLARSTIAACDYTVKIPMSHGVDSLNVAAASAVAFWQLGKQ